MTRIQCSSCEQPIVYEGDLPSGAACPTCGVVLVAEPNVPEETTQSVAPPVPQPPPPPPVQPAPVYIMAAPRQRSIGWGVFWGLVGFFIVLPVGVLVAVLLIGALPPALERAKERAERVHAGHSTTNAGSTTNSYAPKARAKKLSISDLKLGKEFEIIRDPVRGITFIKLTEFPYMTRFELYISAPEESSPSLFLRAVYQEEQRLFFTTILFRTEDRTWTITPRPSEVMEEKRLGTTFWACRRYEVDSGDNGKALAALMRNTNAPTLRFDGTDGYFDLKLTPRDMGRLLAVYKVWEQIAEH